MELLYAFTVQYNYILYFIQDEFPEYPELLLEAISISRRLQDPLMEFCALFASPEEEIFSLKMHILQVCGYLIICYCAGVL